MPKREAFAQRVRAGAVVGETAMRFPVGRERA